MKQMVLAFIAGSCLASAAWAGSAMQGEKLFNDPALGSNGKTCATCHAEGRDLEYVGLAADEDLRESTNMCIRKAMKGEPLADDDPRMAALIAYMRSLAPPQ